MIRKMGDLFAGWARRWMPDPFLFAVLLTFLTFGLGVVATPAGPGEMLDHWLGPKGFWRLLSFSMQMCMILVTGHALASAPAVRRLINRLADVPRGSASAAALTALVAGVAALFNWGLGLIVGALLAREVGLRARARSIRVHYPLVVAAGYSGLLVWHGGLSGSAPLKVTSEAALKEVVGGKLAAEVGAIPLTETLLSPLNLMVGVALLIVIPLAFALLAPGPGEPCEEVSETVSGASAVEQGGALPGTKSPADRLDESRLVIGALVLLGLFALVRVLARLGAGPVPGAEMPGV